MVSDSCKKRFGKIMMEEMELVAQEEIAPRIYSMILKGEMVAQMLPGQFLHIRVPDGSKLLRRPISIAEIDPETQTCRLIYRIEGGGQLSFPNCQSVANSVSWGLREMALISPILAKVRKP